MDQTELCTSENQGNWVEDLLAKSTTRKISPENYIRRTSLTQEAPAAHGNTVVANVGSLQ